MGRLLSSHPFWGLLFFAAISGCQEYKPAERSLENLWAERLQHFVPDSPVVIGQNHFVAVANLETRGHLVGVFRFSSGKSLARDTPDEFVQITEPQIISLPSVAVRGHPSVPMRIAITKGAFLNKTLSDGTQTSIVYDYLTDMAYVSVLIAD